MKIKGFKNCNIYVEGQGIVKTSLLIDNAQIKEISVGLLQEGLLELPDSLIVVPGFVDRHIHGANNCDFMDGSETSIDRITTSIVKEGTTSCLATTMTQSTDNIKKALVAIAKYMEVDHLGATILGLHLEGPFISEKMAGAQSSSYIVGCDKELFEEFNEASNYQIKEVTIAPEQNGEELIDYLSEQKIVASIGHSDANALEASNAISHGVTSMTHTFNALKGLHHRDIGALGMAMLSDKVNCELICDLVHVSPEAIEILYRLKGAKGISLITDSMESKYMADGTYRLGGQEVFVKNGEARLKNGTLAGSTLKMNMAIKNFMKVTKCSLTQAIDCATINPARTLYMDDKIGSIACNKQADFTVIDGNFEVYLTVCGGNITYQK